MKSEQMKIVFIGDSITDVGRSYTDDKQLGEGYVSLIAAQLKQAYPREELDIFNRGISGNRIADLNARIEPDCLALKPTVLSILVGVNDTWHNAEGESFGTQGEAQRFKAEYHAFLTKVKAAGITNIILMEPFVLPIPADRIGWRIDLDQKIQAIRELAVEFQATYLPLDGLLNSLGIEEGFEAYAEDGVHPTLLGHQLIANQWMEKMGPKIMQEG